MEVRSLNHCGRVLLILSSYTDICFALEVDLLAEESDFQGFHQILLSGNFPEPEDPHLSDESASSCTPEPDSTTSESESVI